MKIILRHVIFLCARLSRRLSDLFAPDCYGAYRSPVDEAYRALDPCWRLVVSLSTQPVAFS